MEARDPSPPKCYQCSAFQTAIPPSAEVHAKSASYTEPMMEHCIINQQIKPFASAAEAVGKCITSYDPSCLVATESARSTCLYASRHQPARGSPDRVFGWHPDRTPFGPTGKRFSPVVGGGKWPTNSLLCPYLNASRAGLTREGTDPLFHSIDLSIQARQSKSKRFLRQFFMPRVRAPAGYLTSLISCL